MKIEHVLQGKSCLFMLVLVTCLGLSLGSSVPGWALGPPRPGEIEQLKAEGRYERSLENALRIGNHLADPALAHGLKQKLLRLKE